MPEKPYRSLDVLFPVCFLRKELGSKGRSAQISSISGPSGMIKSTPLKMGSTTGTVLVFTPLPGAGPGFKPGGCNHNSALGGMF